MSCIEVNIQKKEKPKTKRYQAFVGRFRKQDTFT
jgi:hypothetical protein